MHEVMLKTIFEDLVFLNSISVDRDIEKLWLETIKRLKNSNY